MGYVLRTKDDRNNPTLAGGVYGYYITAGRGIYYRWDGSQTRFLIFIADGGKYGLDSISSLEYKGSALDEDDWIFHPGILPAQIVPFNVTGINTSTDVLTATGHTFANNDLIRFGSKSGDTPVGIDRNLKYKVADVSGATFKVKDEAGVSYIDFSDTGTNVIVWKADAGRDDPVQGWPTFVPETASTFSNIAYVEGKLPIAYSDASNPPEWENFRIIGIGRRLMDYDADGNELGLVATEEIRWLANVALQIADNYLVNYSGEPSRIDWTSWFQLKESADQLIWQRVLPGSDPTPGGFTAKYFQNQDYTDLRITRAETTLNMGGAGTDPPAPGVAGTGFSAIFTGTLKPEFSELYTFTFHQDDEVVMFFDGEEVYNNTVYGIHTFTRNLVADQAYNIQINFIQQDNPLPNPWELRFYWQSASQSFEIVPATAVAPQDEQIRRYECHTAFPQAVEASEVHERLMDRVPGWDWTDDEGKIKFLSPDRPVVYTFEFDKMDDDSRPTIVKGTFQKQRRSLAERRNFLLAQYRDVGQTGFPFQYVQADRENLRRFTNGEPSNDPASQLGVSTRSLAERILEMEMVIKTDPNHVSQISGGRQSSKIRKCDLVRIRYYEAQNRKVADQTYLVTFWAWGSSNSKNDYALLPLSTPFYTDEPVTE